MALIKESINEDLGVVVEYWKVGVFCIDTKLEECSFSLDGYVKKGAKKSIETISVGDLMGLEDKTLYNKYFAQDRGKTYKDWQTACYMYAKEHVEFFKDAKDDEDYIAETYGVETLPV